MRKLVIIGTAIAALAVPTFVPAVSAAKNPPPPPTTVAQNGVPLPQEIPGNLVVPAGVTADLQWAHVAGNVSVEGTLSAAATTFDRNVDVNGGHFYGYNAGFVVKGNMEIQNSSDNGWIADGFWTSHYNDFPNGTEIDGNFSYINNTGSFYVQNDGASATVKGNFTYSGNALPYGGGLTVNGHSTIS